MVLQTSLLCAQLPPESAPAASGAEADPARLIQVLLGATTPETRSAKVIELLAELTPAVATALRRETKARCQRGDLEGAEAAAECAVAVGGILNDPAAQGEGHLAWGLVLARQGDHAGAIARYEQALRLAVPPQDTLHEPPPGRAGGPSPAAPGAPGTARPTRLTASEPRRTD